METVHYPSAGMLAPVAGRGAVVLLVLALLSSARSAFAQEFAVDYHGPEQCPTRAEYVAEVARRLPTWRHVDRTEGRRFTVRLRVDEPGSAVGEIDLGPHEQPRVVRGADCPAVVRALALILAVALDPVAALTGEPPAPRTTAPPPTAPPPRAASPTRPPPSPRSSAGPGWGIGASGGVLFGPAPTALYGALLDAEISTAERRFAARLAVARLQTGSVDVGPSEARFALTRARLGLCYRPVWDTTSVGGCLAFDAGSLEADAEPSGELERAERSEKLWTAGGADGRVTFELVGPLRLALAAELTVPLTRQTYFFENPRETVHVVPPVGVGLWGGLLAVVP